MRNAECLGLRNARFSPLRNAFRSQTDAQERIPTEYTNGRAGRRRYALARPSNWVRNVTEPATTQALRSRERIPARLQFRPRTMPLGTLLVGVGNT
jgi:hypothetical protein